MARSLILFLIMLLPSSSFPFKSLVRKTIPILLSINFATIGMSSASAMQYDPEYPGTAVQRMLAARDRVRSLTSAQLNGDWEEVRRNILWAGGLKDLPNAMPGAGYTGHSFNDYNHCDLTTMLGRLLIASSFR